MKRLRKLEAWLKDVILTYQNSAIRPRRRFTNLTSLQSPTQMSGVCARHSDHLTGVLLVTHEPALPNAKAKVLQLASLSELADFSEYADEFFGTAEITPKRSPDLANFIRPEFRVGSRLCIQLANRIRQDHSSLLLNVGFQIGGQSNLLDENGAAIWDWKLKGPLPQPREVLVSLSIARTQDRKIQKMATKLSKSKKDPKNDLPKLQIYGAFHEPAIWFGSPVFLTAKQRILDEPRFPEDDRFVLATGRVDNVPVSLTNDGLLVAFDADIARALNVINQIFAVLSRSGVPSFAVTQGELIKISRFNLLSGQIQSSQSAVIPRNAPDNWISLETQLNSLALSLPNYAAKAAIESAERCASDDASSVISLRLYDALTLFRRESLSEAFVVAWSVIEAIMQRQFEDYWSAQGRSKSKIQDMDWKAGQQIDLLLATERIDSRQARDMHTLRKVRNKIVHELRDATKEEVTNCLETAHQYASLESLPNLEMKQVL